MDTIGKRITYLIEKEGVSKQEFCDRNQLNYHTIVPITTDKRKIGINVLDDLAKAFPNVNINWLLYGKGSPYLIKTDSNNPNSQLGEPSEFYPKDMFQQLILTYLDKEVVKRKILEIVSNGK